MKQLIDSKIVPLIPVLRISNSKLTVTFDSHMIRDGKLLEQDAVCLHRFQLNHIYVCEMCTYMS